MPAQSPPSLDDLLRVLNAATDKNALRWGKTVDEDTFRADLGLGMVRISQDSADSNYALSLIDQEGNLLGKYEPTEPGEVGAFEALYQKVRAKVLNLDRKLKGLYEHIKGLAGES
jgi:hypothetical protein